MDRKSIITALVDHHSSQEYRPEDYYHNVIDTDGRYLGPYVPYIGKHYFNAKPRLLIYAMTQNLSSNERLMHSWLNSQDRGMLRQYKDEVTKRIHVYPYDTGHLKVIAAMVFSLYQGTSFKSTDDISDLVAVTNFVKFSFYRIGRREID